MALSDLLLRLATQAEDLETSASSLRSADEGKALARAAELRDSLADIRSAFSDQAEAGGEIAAERLADLHGIVAERFEQLRAQAVVRVADSAEVVAEQAEQDAANAVDFALHALQQAESLVLAAVVARSAADDLVDDDFESTDLGGPAPDGPAESVSIPPRHAAVSGDSTGAKDRQGDDGAAAVLKHDASVVTDGPGSGDAVAHTDLPDGAATAKSVVENAPAS